MEYKLPPLPTNLPNVVRRIRSCEGEVAAQVVFEHALNEYAIAAIEAQGVPKAVISGALFDFAGFLTTLDEPATFGAKFDASPMVDLIQEFARKRSLSLDNADVGNWSAVLASAPPAPQADKLVKCSYGDNGYACCEGGPCAADVHNNSVQASVVQQEPVAWLVTGPFEKRAFDMKSFAESYCRGLNKGHGEDAYKVSGLVAQSIEQKEKCTNERMCAACYSGQGRCETQPEPQPLSDPLHDDIQSVLFEVQEAIKNGCCPWQIEAAFEAYEAARRLQQPAHGIQGS